jgi:hypothetical protein
MSIKQSATPEEMLRNTISGEAPLALLRKRVDVIALLGFLGLSVFSLRRVLVTSAPVAFHDLAPMYRLGQLLRPYDFPWDYKSNLGSPNMLTGNALYNLPLIGLSWVLGSAVIGHKILLVLLMTFAGFGFYLAFTYLTRSRMAGFAAGLYSMVNPFILERWSYGHNTMLLAYMIMAFAVFFCFKVVSEGDWKSVVACGLLLSMLIATSPHIAYLFIFFMLLYTGFSLIFSKKVSWVERVSLSGMQLSLIFGLAIAATLPFLYQMMRVSLPVYSVRPEEAVLMVSITDVKVAIFPSMALVALIVVFLVFHGRRHDSTGIFSISSLIRLHRWQYSFFLALGLFSMLVCLLVCQPLTPVYHWLFNNVPGFWMFREVNKLFLLTVLSLAFFLGLVAEGLRHFLARSSRTMHDAVAILLISLIILVPSWPFLTGDVGGKVRTVEIPEHYEELEAWFSSQEGDFRVAFFPPAVWATTYDWAPIWFLDPLVALQAKPTVELKSEFDLTSSASLTRWIYTTLYSNRTREWGKLLGLLGVKYVILRLDADMPSYRHDLARFSLENTLTAWENQRGLSFEKTIDSLLIYSNPHQLPHIYQAEGFSLVVGNRRTLLSLHHSGFTLYESPAVFLEDEIDSTSLLIRDARYIFFQGNPYWTLLASSLGEKYIVKPWLHASISANPCDKWVTDDLMWHYFNGDLNVAPDGYIYTEGLNTIALPLKVEESGDYRILAQVFDGLPDSQGIKFTVNNIISYTFTPSRYSEGFYQWVEIGRLTINDQSMIQISGLGGPNAVSKLALVPEEAIKEIEGNVSEQLRGSDAHLIYLFDDYSWSYDPGALIINPEASNGRLIALSSSSIETRFHVFRNAVYTLTLRLHSSSEDAVLTVHFDDHLERVKVGKASTMVDLDPIGLKRGNHTIKIEVEKGDVRLDLAILSSGISDPESPSSTCRDPDDVGYHMFSGSEYLIDGAKNYLVFLEAGGDYWRLYGGEGEVAPLCAFGYACLFQLSEQGQLSLRYLGLKYLKEGFLLALPVFTFVALGLKFLIVRRPSPHRSASKSQDR